MEPRNLATGFSSFLSKMLARLDSDDRQVQILDSSSGAQASEISRVSVSSCEVSNNEYQNKSVAMEAMSSNDSMSKIGVHNTDEVSITVDAALQIAKPPKGRQARWSLTNSRAKLLKIRPDDGESKRTQVMSNESRPGTPSQPADPKAPTSDHRHTPAGRDSSLLPPSRSAEFRIHPEIVQSRDLSDAHSVRSVQDTTATSSTPRPTQQQSISCCLS